MTLCFSGQSEKSHSFVSSCPRSAPNLSSATDGKFWPAVFYAQPGSGEKCRIEMFASAWTQAFEAQKSWYDVRVCLWVPWQSRLNWNLSLIITSHYISSSTSYLHLSPSVSLVVVSPVFPPKCFSAAWLSLHRLLISCLHRRAGLSHVNVVVNSLWSQAVCVALLLELKRSQEAEEVLCRTSDPKWTGQWWTVLGWLI